MDPFANSPQDAPIPAEAAFQRGLLLLQRDRPFDAAPFFQQAVAADPEEAAYYSYLALCWVHDPKKTAQALETARIATRLAPEDSTYWAHLAAVQLQSSRDGNKAELEMALQSGRKALSLLPDDAYARSIVASIHLQLEQPAMAEKEARNALALDLDNTSAAQTLSLALLQQGKNQENASLISYQLQENPEDTHAHVSAGFAALFRGDHQQANSHFKEALRLDPANEAARYGLVESFRSRNVIYRSHLRFCHWLEVKTGGNSAKFMLIGYVIYQVVHTMTKDRFPSLAMIILCLWVCFCFWSHLASGIGGFFLLFDRYARHSLRRLEYWEGFSVGVGALLSLLFGILSVTSNLSPLLAFSALMTTVALAAVFPNSHYLGRKVYAAIAGLALLSFVAGVYVCFWGGEQAFFPVLLPSILLGVAVSWMRSFSLLFH